MGVLVLLSFQLSSAYLIEYFSTDVGIIGGKAERTVFVRQTVYFFVLIHSVVYAWLDPHKLELLESCFIGNGSGMIYREALRCLIAVIEKADLIVILIRIVLLIAMPSALWIEAVNSDIVS